MKELGKGNVQIRYDKEYKSINPHSIGSINEKNKKMSMKRLNTNNIVTDKFSFNIIVSDEDG
jgi:hypothetical protein